MTDQKIPYSVNNDGGVSLWPADLDRLVFGPGLTLDEAGQVAEIIAEARRRRAAYLGEVIVLADRRDRAGRRRGVGPASTRDAR